MKFREMLFLTDPECVFEVFKFFGWGDGKVCKEAINRVYVKLMEAKPKNSKWQIEIYADVEETDTPLNQKHPILNPDEVLIFDTKPSYQSMRRIYYHIHSISPSKKDRNERFGMDFVPWAEWLGMDVSEHTRLRYAPHFIVALAIWDMTFYGWDEKKMAEEKQRILDIAKESKEHPENCISFEDLKKSLELDVD